MAEVLSNYTSSPLNMPAGLDHDDTTVTVTDGSTFPPVGNFRIIIQQEIMICTARSGNDLTVIRGQEDRDAVAHSTGSLVEVILTAGAIAQYVSEH